MKVYVVICEQLFASPALFYVVGVYDDFSEAERKASENDSYRVEDFDLIRADISPLSTAVQYAIVCERNNYGDWSVHGDDLALATYMTAWALGCNIPECTKDVIREAMPEFVKQWIK